MSVSGGEAEGLKRQIGIGFAVPPELTDAAKASSHVVRTLIEAVRNTFRTVYFLPNVTLK